MTYYEIAHGELSEGQGIVLQFTIHTHKILITLMLDFFEIDKTLLNKALQILVKRGTAQIFKGTDEDSMGIKFFGSQ